MIWYGYQYWFQDRWPPGLNGSPSTERLHAFLADYRAEKTRAYKTEFEAVDAKIFANRMAPLLLSDSEDDRLLVQKPTIGTYRAPLVSNAEPARASVNAVGNGIVLPESIAASAPADAPVAQSPLKTELVPELPLEEYSWQWLIELTDYEFQSGLERFLRPIPSHQTEHYRIALVTGRRHLQNNHGHGVLARAVAAAAAAIKRELHCEPGLNGKPSSEWIKQLLMGDYKNVKAIFLQKHSESVSK